MKITFITTVYNEETTINKFLDSLFNQSIMPDEIIIIDGGSRDATVKKIKDLRDKYKKFKGKFIVITKKGNRAVGRNEAIKQATGDIILCSDAGNILDKDWVKNIVEPFSDAKVDVVSGFYKGIGKTVFQKCVIPYALVMPDKVVPANFLPATRSVAFKKSIWEKVGGFNEKLSHNEDYAFAKALLKIKANIVFAKNAIVYWIPRNSYHQAFIMMYRFAYGDAEARIFRPKVLFVFLRYIFGLIFLVFSFLLNFIILWELLIVLVVLYLLWAALKNYKYVKSWQALIILPQLQLVADWAVLKGTIMGLLGRSIRYN